MAKLHPLAVEVHFVPLPPGEAMERGQRLRVLLLRGAIRLLQKHEEGTQDPDTLVPVPVNAAWK